MIDDVTSAELQNMVAELWHHVEDLQGRKARARAAATASFYQAEQTRLRDGIRSLLQVSNDMVLIITKDEYRRIDQENNRAADQESEPAERKQPAQTAATGSGF